MTQLNYQLIENELRAALVKAITKDRWGAAQTGVVRLSEFKMKNVARFAPTDLAPAPAALVNCHLWEHLNGIIDPGLFHEIDVAVETAVETLEGEGLARRGGVIENTKYPADDWLTLTLKGVRTMSGPQRTPGSITPIMPAPPTTTASGTVFISYTHEDDAHKSWVLKLATDLRTDGVNVVLDQWDLKKGADLMLFMERGVRESARVLLVFTPTYCTKANDRLGGVGYESLVVTGELAADLSTEKFVGILRRGDWTTSVPSFQKTRNHIDMRDDAEYAARLQELLRELHGVPSNPKPPLGKNPFTP